jgi:hypothetical protein
MATEMLIKMAHSKIKSNCLPALVSFSNMMLRRRSLLTIFKILFFQRLDNSIKDCVLKIAVLLCYKTDWNLGYGCLSVGGFNKHRLKNR